jgi:hypothetical protein
MNENRSKQWKKRAETVRRGAATIEFVLALPILMLLIVSLTWLGFSMHSQAEVNVVARHLAWQQRHENTNSDAFIFATHPGYGRDGDFVQGDSEQVVNVSRLFDAFSNPEATELVLSGSWDHRALPLDNFPNWHLYGEAIVNAKTADLQNLLGGMNNFRNILGGIGSGFLNNQLGALSGLMEAPSNEIENTKSDQELSSELKELAFAERKTVLDEEIKILEDIKRKQSGFLNPTQARKLFRLTSERSDVVFHLQMLG